MPYRATCAVLAPIATAALILGPEFLGLGPEQPGRRFESAVVTGTLAAFSGWLGCALLACGVLMMRYS